ncbi:radical SAM protein [Dyella sp. Tek66A03]|uniref:radical SAM protein n=1 Tax=Dyella sp. Tek66A03 TaxID=3458298 RepID=UPI00403E9840
MSILSHFSPSRRLPLSAEDPSVLRTKMMPSVAWIELTSRCPFDCVFCSRKLLRGKGQHMDIEMFRRIIQELGEPEIIRLNYSGESSHHPHIVEACELASRTGATVELVTALSSVPWHRVDALAHAGISRLTISLHTLDEQRFKDIYRFSSIDEMRARIERIVELSQSAPRRMEVNFAFVAMQRNLEDLHAIADYASTLGLKQIDIHPIIRRDPIPETFADELDGERLRPSFLAALNGAITRTRNSFPDLTFNVSTPEVDERGSLNDEAHPYPWPLTSEARIHGCEQDPWHTVHILADGEVVTCERRDQIVMGRLGELSLADIWHSPSYLVFRANYLHAKDKKCRACPYKIAARPGRAPSKILAPSLGRAGLIYGWHLGNDDEVFWSQGCSRIELYAQGKVRLVLRGLLPRGQQTPNKLTLRANGDLLHTWQDAGVGMTDIHFDQRLVVAGSVILELETSQTFCPQTLGTGDDNRRLGFALIEANLGS